jgi:hypothetical protein
MQCALVGLHAHGYRPDTKRLGHHATIVQSLALTLNVHGPRVHALDKLREKRNLPTTPAPKSTKWLRRHASHMRNDCCRKSATGCARTVRTCHEQAARLRPGARQRRLIPRLSGDE